MENQSEIICRFCGSKIERDVYFCSNCGKQLRDKPLSTTLFRKMVAYAVSFFLPPFGLYYAWKYLRAGDYESKKVGVISIILTAISLAITIWLTAGFVNSVYQSINELNSLNI